MSEESVFRPRRFFVVSSAEEIQSESGNLVKAKDFDALAAVAISYRDHRDQLMTYSAELRRQVAELRGFAGVRKGENINKAIERLKAEATQGKQSRT